MRIENPQNVTPLKLVRPPEPTQPKAPVEPTRPVVEIAAAVPKGARAEVMVTIPGMHLDGDRVVDVKIEPRAALKALLLQALAAAALVLLVVTLREPTPPTAVMRGDAVTVEPVAPIGEIAALPDLFVWTAVDGATQYRLEVLDADARVVSRQVVSTTSARLETGVPPEGA